MREVRRRRTCAAARHVDPARLVFAPITNYSDHLARQKLADLFLDAGPTTAARWPATRCGRGLPVLMFAGRSYAARMAGSLLQAVGLPELVTHSPEAYAALALRLATDAELPGGLRRMLAANTAPLFDTDRFRRHIEPAYRQMWDRHLRGEPPATFTVESLA